MRGEPAVDPKLIAWLRCPECRSALTQPAGDRLACTQCGATYGVRDGVPRFVKQSTPTAVAFGYIWGEQAAKVTPPTHATAYHLHQMHDALGAPPLAGLVIDGGCGDGVDLAMQALDPSREIVGVELSDGGVTTSIVRTRGLSRAHVVQGDLLKLPLADDTFDAGYSYGVVHHTPDPARAVRELARVLKPGAPLLLYVYEDFGERPLRWRAALAAVNSLRAVTTRLPVTALMTLCRIMSPVVWLACTVPARRFSWARNFPYRHNTHPWSLVGDLYDRFSAPIEFRYSEKGACDLVEQAGLVVKRTANRRGRMVWAEKPSV
jgi:SAM-dependent methyltransferase